MDTISNVVKDVINSLNKNLAKVNDIQTTDINEDNVIDSDFSDDSIDPQIEYDLIIDESATTFCSLLTTDEDNDGPDGKQILVDSVTDKTTTDVSIESAEDKPMEESIPIETTPEVVINSTEYCDKEPNEDISSGHQNVESIVSKGQKKLDKPSDKLVAKDLSTKTAKKSSNKNKAKKNTDKKSKRKSNIRSNRTSNQTPNENCQQNHKKLSSKRPKVGDKKYRMKRSSELSPELLEQLFGKCWDQSAKEDINSGGDCTQLESMYSQQCDEWFRRQTRRKTYDFKDQTSETD